MPRRFFRRISAGFRREQGYPWYLQPFRALLTHPTFFSVSRRSVSGAIWVGLFLGLLPLPAQTAIAVLAALLLRVNLAIAGVSVWITNPVTMLPIYYAEYRLGALILDIPVQGFGMNISWAWFAEELGTRWQPLLLGSFVTATVVASTAYVAISVIWRTVVTLRYRRRRRALATTGQR